MLQLPSLSKRIPMLNGRDLVALPIVIGLFFLIGWATSRMTIPYTPGEKLSLSLNPTTLPADALYTVLRMIAALAASFLFTLVYATLAAKNRFAEKILIPILDILQSVPILGFLSITVSGFIALFPGNLWGVQMAVIFAVFTSQAWNMTFSLYQSLKTVPSELQEAAESYGLSPWIRLWRLELPYAMPNLLWNMMMSVSGGWFFIVAAEAITVAGHRVMVPGIGSYIALAISERNLSAIIWSIVTMLVVIWLYDTLFFRPLIAWADKFKYDTSSKGIPPESKVMDFLQHTQLLKKLTLFSSWIWEISLTKLSRQPPSRESVIRINTITPWLDRLFWMVIGLLGTGALVGLEHMIPELGGWHAVGHVFWLGLFTATRVFALVALASLIWVPIGIWIGLRPSWAQHVQPLAQFLAAFPANLLFPLVVLLIVRFQLNPNIWTSPLMILGSQWYILFNVIGGASALPQELKEAAQVFGLRGWRRYYRFLLPGIFQTYVTGALTASGGAWNASIVAEVVSWGNHTLIATGLGAYITEATAQGNLHKIALGISVMAIYVILINRLIWHPLYRLAESRLRLD